MIGEDSCSGMTYIPSFMRIQQVKNHYGDANAGKDTLTQIKLFYKLMFLHRDSRVERHKRVLMMEGWRSLSIPVVWLMCAKSYASVTLVTLKYAPETRYSG